MQVRRQLLDVLPDAAQVVDEGLHVAAGAERPPGAGDDDAAHVGILVQLQRGLEQLAPQRQIERVVRLGPVEGQRGDVGGALDDQILVRHACSPRDPRRCRGAGDGGAPRLRREVPNIGGRGGHFGAPI